MQLDLPLHLPRTGRFVQIRACERVDPRAVWGKALPELNRDEMIELMAFERVRQAEESAAWGRIKRAK